MQERNLKEVLQKKEESTIKQKMEFLYEEILDELLVNQKSLTKTERVKLFVTLSNYIFPKTYYEFAGFIVNGTVRMISDGS